MILQPPPPQYRPSVNRLPPIPLLIFKSRICFSWLYSLYRSFPIPPFFASHKTGGIGGSTVSSDITYTGSHSLILVNCTPCDLQPLTPSQATTAQLRTVNTLCLTQNVDNFHQNIEFQNQGDDQLFRKIQEVSCDVLLPKLRQHNFQLLAVYFVKPGF